MKKKIVGGIATAAFLTAFSGEASAASHEVKSGDTLWKIANQYKTTVSKIKQLNNLSSDTIFPRQVLTVDGTPEKPQTSQKASSPAASTAQTANGNTYKVKSGDYLIKIANMHGISLGELKLLNGLSGDMIRVGQVLKVGGNAAANTAPAPSTSSKPAQSQQASSSSSYKVVAGDTLSRIASRNGTTVSQLKGANGLTSDLIYVGQVLKLKGGSAATVSKPQASASASKAPTANNGNVVSVAKSMLGTKYAWGGTTPSGFDCSGFIHYAYNNSGKSIARTNTGGYYNRSFHVSSPQAGDLVFFKNTYKSGISHVGIFLGGGQFIHAGDSGVQISSLGNSYWKSKFDSYKRLY